MAITLAEALFVVDGDTTRLRPEVVPEADKVGKESGQKMGKSLGASLNTALKKLNLDDIDIKASPQQALKSIATTRDRLDELRRTATTVELKVQAEKGLAQLKRFERDLGEVTDDAGALNSVLEKLKLQEIDLNAEDAQDAIEATERKLKELTAKPYTAEVRVEAERGLRELNGLKEKIGKAGKESGPGFVKNLGESIGSSLSKIPITPQVAAALGAAALTAAPVLASIAAGGIIGGVGAGGVVGGVTVAAKDERVKKAFGELGAGLETRLQRAAGAFVPEVLNGIGTIRRSLDRVDIESIFGDASKFVSPLSRGLGDLVSNLSVGLQRLTAVAGPVIDQIGYGLARVGASLGEGLSSLADNAEEGAAGMKILFMLLDVGIRTVFNIINVFTELYGIIHKLGIDAVFLTALKLLGTEMDDTKVSANGVAGGVAGVGAEMEVAREDTLAYKLVNDQLTETNKALQLAQKDLTGQLDQLGGKMSGAELRASSLKTAMTNLYGAEISATEANEAYEASFDALSLAIEKSSKKKDVDATSLDLHTTAGRSNRDALQDLLTKNNELYIANVAAGQSIEQATKKHRDRTEQVRKESIRLGLNDKETDKLIKTYGRIPPEKATDLVLEGVREVVTQLRKLYIYQRSLATGKSIESIEDTMRKGNDIGPAKGGGYAHGGRYGGGRVPGSPSSVDNMHGRGPAGEEIGLAGGEWIINSKQSAEYSDVLEQINRGAARFAEGGQYLVDTSRRWPFETDVGGTRIPSRKEVASKVIPAPGAFGQWPASPSAQRGDSGVWRKVVALIRSTGPLSGAFGNAYRPGDPLWHGSGRAVDWMGYNQDRLASFLAARHPLELIHQTSSRSYAYTRGRNMGSFDAQTMAEHLNHIHVAFGKGGRFREQMKAALFDYGGTLAPGINVVENKLGRPEPLVRADQAGDVHIHLHDSVIASQQQFEDMMVKAWRSAKSKKRVSG